MKVGDKIVCVDNSYSMTIFGDKNYDVVSKSRNGNMTIMAMNCVLPGTCGQDNDTVVGDYDMVDDHAIVFIQLRFLRPWNDCRVIKKSRTKDVLSSVMDSINSFVGNHVKEQSKTLDAMRACCDREDLDGFMELKQQLMLDTISSLPLGPSHCPYCGVSFYYGCDGCEYGKTHGICGIEGSTISIIGTAVVRLGAALRQYAGKTK